MCATLFVMAALGLGQCAEFATMRQHYFVVKVDSVQVPATARQGDTLGVHFWGVIGNDGCYSFSHFDVHQDSSGAAITVWGVHTPEQVCAAVMVTLDGRTLNLVPKKKGLFSITVHQPDKTTLQRNVTIQ